MSSSFVARPALHFAGPAVRGWRSSRVPVLKKFFSHTNHGRLSGQPIVFQKLPRQDPHSVLKGFGSSTPTSLDVLSCSPLNRQLYSCYSSVAWFDSRRMTQTVALRSTVDSTCPLYINPLTVSDSPLALQLRFMSEQSRLKDRKVLSGKGGQQKSVRNSRRSSERTEDRATPKNKDDVTASGEANKPTAAEGVEEAEKLTLYQRFKKTYREHGKVLVAVHVATSVVWFGTFYTAASLGFDIVPLLESWNLSERVISPFRSGGLGNVALAYLLYKLATPARYTVTIGGTNLAIRYLQREGRMKVVPKEDSLRSLYKEGKEDIKDRSKERMSRIRRRTRRARRHTSDQNGHKQK